MAAMLVGGPLSAQSLTLCSRKFWGKNNSTTSALGIFSHGKQAKHDDGFYSESKHNALLSAFSLDFATSTNWKSSTKT